VATSSFQTDGSPCADWTDWDYRLGLSPHHVVRYRDLAGDLDLLKELGVNAYRFSVEWSRLEPRPGSWNAREVGRLGGVVERLAVMGITPMVTLHHFTHPRWFAEQGAWNHDDAVDRFLGFASQVVESIPSVRYWITFNEPLVFLLGGYVDGCMPPGRRDLVAATDALERILEAHALVYRLIHRINPGAMVGVAHNMCVFAPSRSWHPLDRLFTTAVHRTYNEALVEAFVHGRLRIAAPFLKEVDLETPVAGTLDFIGVNYYTRFHLAFQPAGRGDRPMEVRGRDAAGEGLTDMGWEVHPEGFGRMLRIAARAGVPILVTENGIATEDDQRKIDFIRRHLDVLEVCRAEGLDIRGYFYWSLTDTYEWLHGFDKRFGLYRVDWESGQRTATSAARYYGDLVRQFFVRPPLTQR
jgi:beta-glucosidase